MYYFDNDDDDDSVDYDYDEFRNFGNQPVRINIDKKDEDDDDDNSSNSSSSSSTSCASTVVNDKPPRIVRPPPTATKEEQAKFYWELCYGKNSNPPTTTTTTTSTAIIIQSNPNWTSSANKKPPMKSCLSAKKTKWTEIAQSSSKRSARRERMMMLMTTDEKRKNQVEKRTPTVMDQFGFTSTDTKVTNDGSDQTISNLSPLERQQQEHMNGKPQQHGFDYTPNMKTPQSQNDNNNNNTTTTISSIKSVKFGDSQAAEFESSRPTVELTPLPSDKVREQYPVEEKDVLSDDESTELHHETARNGQRLAMWDDDFDEYVDEWEDNDDDDDDVELKDDNFRESTSSSLVRGNNSASVSSRRSQRRSSVFFSRGGGSLVQFEDSKNKVEDIEESKIIHDNLQETVDVDNTKESPVSRDSMQFSSPSISSSYRLSSSDSETSKVTPKADLHSSSSLLRSVHSAGGAHMGRNNDIGHDDTTQDFRPSQLDETLQKAESSQNSNHAIYKTISQKSSLTDEIIEEMIVEPNKTLINKFGCLVKERSRLFDKSFENTMSAELVQMMSDWELHSYIDVSDKVIKLIDNETPPVCVNDAVEVLKMMVSFLEREIKTTRDCDAKKLQAYSTYAKQSLDYDDRTDLYSSLIDSAFSQWDRLESQAFQTVSSCFQLVNQSNFDEEATIKDLLQKSHYQGVLKNSKKMCSMHEQIENEKESIANLLSMIDDEEMAISRLCHISSFWESKVELERNAPVEAVDLILLKTFLTFTERLLTMNQVNVSYQHLDEHSSETQIKWISALRDTPERRQSLSSIDSADGMIELLASTPSIKRTQNQRNHTSFTPDDIRLPSGSPAHKIYTTILNDEGMNRFLLKCCKQEQETGILTVTDVFQRLNLMAMDVLEINKYYSCRVERPTKSTAVMLNVTISFGTAMSIGIRFTYDLAIQRTFLYSMPSEVFIKSIAGEPAVPLNILTKVANFKLSSGHLSNAFLLKRTCSSIVDTLQGRDDVCYC